MTSEKIGTTTSQAALASFYAGTYLLLLGPLAIYANNLTEFSLGLVSQVLFFLPAITASMVVLFVLLVLTPVWLSTFLLRVMATICLTSWVYANFLYGDYGRLDGRALTIEPWSTLAMVQIGVFLVIAIAASRARLSVIRQVLLFVFMIALISLVVGLASNWGSLVKDLPSGFHKELTKFSPEKNVIHVVLDTLQTDLLTAAMAENPDILETLDGFTLYQDNASVYRTTAMSIPMLVTGRVYKNEITINQFLKDIRAKPIGVYRLQQGGFRLDALAVCHTKLFDQCTAPSPKVLEAGSTSSESLNLLDIFIFKSTPEPLKTHVYNGGDWLLVQSSSYNDYVKLGSTGVAHLILEKFVDEMSVSDVPKPRYKLIHSFVTHPPYRLKPNCKIAEVDMQRKAPAVDAIQCGMRHLAAILSKIKSLGLYDRSMIIVSADHGAGWLNEELKETFSESEISASVVAYASAALLIKPYQSRGPLLYSEVHSSLLDIPTTILSAHGINVDYTDDGVDKGRNIFELEKSELRPRDYYHYTWKNEYWALSTLPPLSNYHIVGDLKEPESWSFEPEVGEPLTCGQTELFSDVQSDVVALRGLSAAEHWGRWSDGSLVILAFAAPSEACGSDTLELELRAYTPPEHPTQQATVFLNGQELGELAFQAGQPMPRRFTFPLPSGLLKQAATNRLHIRIKDPVSPKSLGKSKNSREIGIGFVSLLLN
jgi:hypothetical protein